MLDLIIMNHYKGGSRAPAVVCNMGVLEHFCPLGYFGLKGFGFWIWDFGL